MSSSAHADGSGGAEVYHEGDVFTWGTGKDGQLGHSEEKVLTPQKVHVLPEAVAHVALGATTSAAVGESGALYTWGTCEYGSLGHGPDVTVCARPALVTALRGIPMAAVSVGEHHMAALSADGEVFTWGWGGSLLGGPGALGHGSRTTQYYPALVEALADGGHVVTQVSAGGRHTLALTADGTVMGWGKGEYGRLGNGKRKQLLPEPCDLLLDAGVHAVQVAAGGSYSAVVDAEGAVWMFGRNDQSQLGLGANLTMDINSMEEFPVRNRNFGGAKVVAVAAGKQHALAITDDNGVYYWGSRQFIEPERLTTLDGTLGGSLPLTRPPPTRLPCVCLRPPLTMTAVRCAGKDVVQVAAGDGFSAAVTAAGEVFTWGKGYMSGALGHAKSKGEKHPRHVEAFSEMSVAFVALGAKHAAAILGHAPADVQRV